MSPLLSQGYTSQTHTRQGILVRLAKSEGKPVKPTLIRTIISLLFGLLVACIALLATLHQVVEGIDGAKHPASASRIEKIVALVEAYQNDKHTLPDLLYDVSQRNVDDPWGNPLVYEVKEGHYHIASFGADGKPGGVGVDADVTSDNLHSDVIALPLSDVIHRPEAQGVVITAGVSGVLSALLCFGVVRPTALPKSSTRGVILQITLLLLAVSILASFITALHVPSGH